MTRRIINSVRACAVLLFTAVAALHPSGAFGADFTDVYAVSTSLGPNFSICYCVQMNYVGPYDEEWSSFTLVDQCREGTVCSMNGALGEICMLLDGDGPPEGWKAVGAKEIVHGGICLPEALVNSSKEGMMNR